MRYNKRSHGHGCVVLQFPQYISYYTCASQRLHQFTHAIQIVVSDEVYQEKRWYELNLSDKIIDLICSLDDQIPPHVQPWEWGGIASVVMQDLWNGIINAECETCGTTSSNKFQPTPVPNLPHVVIPVVLHFISF